MTEKKPTKKTAPTPKAPQNVPNPQMAQEQVPIPISVDVATHIPEDGGEKLVLLRVFSGVQTQFGMAQLPPTVVPLLAKEARDTAQNLINAADGIEGKRPSGLVIP